MLRETHRLKTFCGATYVFSISDWDIKEFTVPSFLKMLINFHCKTDLVQNFIECILFTTKSKNQLCRPLFLSEVYLIDNDLGHNAVGSSYSSANIVSQTVLSLNTT